MSERVNTKKKQKGKCGDLRWSNQWEREMRDVTDGT